MVILSWAQFYLQVFFVFAQLNYTKVQEAVPFFICGQPLLRKALAMLCKHFELGSLSYFIPICIDSKPRTISTVESLHLSKIIFSAQNPFRKF